MASCGLDRPVGSARCMAEARNDRGLKERRRIFLLGLILLSVIFAAPLSRAQDNYEIQVYGSDLVDPGHTMVELHSNFTIDGSKTVVDGVYPTNHAEHETVEITHGVNDWLECGFYIFTSITEGQGWEWVGDHIRPRVAVPKKWHWPVGVSISNEIGYQRRQYSVDTWTWEIRPIVDQKVGRWYWSLQSDTRPLISRRDCEPGRSFFAELQVQLRSHAKNRGRPGILRIGRSGERVRRCLTTTAPDLPRDRLKYRSAMGDQFRSGRRSHRRNRPLDRQDDSGLSLQFLTDAGARWP